jgi:hypothetical protein
MTTETLDEILAAGRSLPQNVFDGDDLPLPNSQTLKPELQWRQLESGDRERLIKDVAGITEQNDLVRTLFLLWTWESESDLRGKIVTSFPLEPGAESVPPLLLICLHEVPGATGSIVIEKAKERLRAIASGESPVVPVRHRVRTLGAPVKTAFDRAPSRTAIGALATIEAVEANRRLVTR